MLLLERRINFPIDVFATPRVLSYQHDRARAARDVVFAYSPHDIINILTVEFPLKRVVRDYIVCVAECLRKGLVIRLVAAMMVTHENFTFDGLRVRSKHVGSSFVRLLWLDSHR